MSPANNVNKAKTIAFLCPYPVGGAPSQRFRYEQYLLLLFQQGFSYRIYPFLDQQTNDILYQPGHYRAKIIGVLRGFGRRFTLLFRLGSFDFVFIHREAVPVGPPVVEWIIARVWCKKIIYDFDDAIWLPDSHADILSRLVKWRAKVTTICRRSERVSVGNAYLADFARRYNPRVVINPTTIDTEHHHDRIQQQDTALPVIGWTGSHSTLPYLDALVPVIAQLEEQFTFQLLVIADQPPVFHLDSLRFIPWQYATEIDDLLRMHIGLMPLPDDPWARGKCGFKALQYLALGIPALVSPVGVNTEIVTHGVDGFHCRTDEDWYQHLAYLLQRPSERAAMGKAGRATVEERYSVKANAGNFLELFA